MARQKRSSTVLKTARERLSGLRAITPPPDFGPTLKLDDYEQDINKVSDKLDEYHRKLAEADALLNEFEALEQELNDKNKRMLAATGAQFGTNSSNYELAGGTRDDERKPPSKKGSTKG
jgi:uncharacterized coiled-coil DUF342 family protein